MDERGYVVKPEITYAGSFVLYGATKKGSGEPVCFSRISDTDLYTRNYTDKHQLQRDVAKGVAVFK